MELNSAPPAVATSFERDVASVLQRVRGDFAAVIAAIPPGDVHRAAELQKALRLDKKLAWKLFRVISAVEPLAIGLHVPGPANLRTFLRAAARRGVPERLIEQAAEAGSEFEQLVTRHAGDRPAFDSMVSGLIGEDAGDQLDLVHRRAAFRANRHVWGVQAQTLLRCLFVRPEPDDPSKLSVAMLQGYCDLRRLRPGPALIVARVSVADDDGTVRAVRLQPLDCEGETSRGMALVRAFCSQPLPQFRTFEPMPGITCAELVMEGIGSQAAATFVHGHFIPFAADRFSDPANMYFHSCLRVRYPCEALVSDMIVHEGTFGGAKPEVGVFGEQSTDGPPPNAMSPADRLCQRETVRWVGRGSAVLHSPDFPRYAELLGWVFERLGWDPSRFDLYRCRIEYPVMPSTVRVSIAKPEASA